MPKVSESTWRESCWRYVRTPAGNRERLRAWRNPSTLAWHWSAGGHVSEGFVDLVPCTMAALERLKALGWKA
jgi:hypothetical protein